MLKSALLIVLVFGVFCCGFGQRYLLRDPFITGDHFRAMADHVIDGDIRQFKAQDVKEGDIIFLKTDKAQLFVPDYLEKIAKPFILITHNSDINISLDVKEFNKIVNNRFLIKWYAQNLLATHPKLVPIPLGVSNARFVRGQPACHEAFSSYVNSCKNYKKNYLSSLMVNIATNFSCREPLVKFFWNKKFVFTSPPQNFETYLEVLCQSKFVFSPQGCGFDCYRTWEALYLNAIPIVETSAMDALFEDLPVLIVDDWYQITEEFLKEEYKKILSKKYNLSKIWMPYWIDLIQTEKKQFIKNLRNFYQ